MKALLKIFTFVSLAALSPQSDAARLLTTTHQHQGQQLWLFGDSSSDNGNLSLIFGTDNNNDTFLPPEAYKPYQPLPAPVPQLQRITNGKVVAEYVAEFYHARLLPSRLRPLIGAHAANNFATYSALTNGPSPLDFPAQVAEFASRVRDGSLNVCDDRAAILIGANDVFNAWLAAIGPFFVGQGKPDRSAANDIIKGAIASLNQNVLKGDNSLVGLGIRKFVVLSVPDLSQTPFVRQFSSGLPPNLEEQALQLMLKLLGRFNGALKRLVKVLNRRNTKAIKLSLFSTSRFVAQNFRVLGFVNGTAECFQSNTFETLTEGAAPSPREFRPQCSEDTIDKFVFLDTVHPTARAQRITAQILSLQLVKLEHFGG